MSAEPGAEIIRTDVLVIGGGAAGMAAALAAAEAGAEVLVLHKGPSATAISTGFLTFAAHEGFTAQALGQAMAEVTGKGLCDKALLRRFVEEGPAEIGAALEAYGIPVDPAPRGVRVRRARGVNGAKLTGEDTSEPGRKDMTSVVMEFSATHGTSLFSKLLAAGKEAGIERVKGLALELLRDGPGARALIEGRMVTVLADAVVLATGGLQGLYEFTDVPLSLTGDGHAMALEAGAALIDMEFIQFYPLALAEEGLPTLFIYPDFPEETRLINDLGEDVLAKHFGDSQRLGTFDNWDHLCVAEQAEIAAGRELFLDFSAIDAGAWTEDSLARDYLAKYVGDFRARPVRVSPIAHYTIGGVRVDANGETGVPGLYACGEVAGGLHGANRHGGTSLAEGLTFGRICGRHAARRSGGRERVAPNDPPPPERRAGEAFDQARAMAHLRRRTQLVLGPLRDGEALEALGAELEALAEEAEALGWEGHGEYARVLGYRRALRLVEIMRRCMLGRTESRGVHNRADFPESDSSWLRKHAVRLNADSGLYLENISF